MAAALDMVGQVNNLTVSSLSTEQPCVEGRERSEVVPHAKLSPTFRETKDALSLTKDDTCFESGIEKVKDYEAEYECDECVVKTAMIRALRSQLHKAREEIKRLKAVDHEVAEASILNGTLDKVQFSTVVPVAGPGGQKIIEGQSIGTAGLVPHSLQHRLEQAMAGRAKAEIRAAVVEEELSLAKLEIIALRQLGEPITLERQEGVIHRGRPHSLDDWSVQPLWPMIRFKSILETNKARVFLDFNAVAIDDDASDSRKSNIEARWSTTSSTSTSTDQPDLGGIEKREMHAYVARAAMLLAAKNIWGPGETPESVAFELRELIEVIDRAFSGNCRKQEKEKSH
jgi:hypothetical protein